MASMPTYHVSKGPFHVLDEEFGPPNFMGAYNRVLHGTDGGPALGSGAAATTLQQRTGLQVGANHLTNAQATHFANDWLATWWQGLAVADTLRLGMIEAINCAQAANSGNGLPMEFFWICVQDHIFQIYYSEGERQVTVLLLTPPPPPAFNAGPLKTPENVWVVKESDPFDAAYPTVNGTPAGLVPAPQTLGPTTSPSPGTIIKQQIWRA
jgi:hypothetical protein